jgi:4-alpha-glucanotransferase
MTRFARESGILLHPSSLPGPYGIGSTGAAAFTFIDQLAQAEQAVWQVLPLHATGGLASPYSATTTFALNPLLLDLDLLVADGLLSDEDLAPLADLPDSHVDYARVIPLKLDVVFKAGVRLAAQTGTPLASKLAGYRRKHGKAWLNDFALYEALKAAHGQQAWVDWPAELRDRKPAALRRARAVHCDTINATMAVQFLAERQWQALRTHAAKQGVWILGDMAIFVAHDSADTWVNPGQFKLDDAGHPKVMAGVPPDYFSATGQLWGNPIYDWAAQEADGFSWWKARMGRLLELADGVRIDHFRGFAACWEIPAGAPNAIVGEWVPAPGHALFAAILEAWPEAKVVAEDLGLITPDVLELRDAFGFPGLKILQFEFGGDGPHGERHPYHYPAASVTYTGTHDNNTVVGWFRNEGADQAARAADFEREAANALALMGGDGSDIHWRFIELAAGSGSALAIMALQDVMGLGGDGRMNVPGTIDGNWQWRYRDGDFTADQIERLAQITRANRRTTGA